MPSSTLWRRRFPLPSESAGWRSWRAGLCGFVVALATPAVALAAPTLPGELDNPLADPEDCAECHSFSNSPETKEDPLVAPIAWRGTLMANAARDPVFWAAVAIAFQDQEEADETEDCVRCHSPQAFLSGRASAIALEELEPLDRAGIECDFCHRMVDDGETPAGNARYVLDDVLGIDGKVPKRGPWTYAPGEEPLHSWALGEFLAESRSCGTCHDVTTPRERVDAEGQGMGVPFNEQRTYSEWLGSAYGPGGSDPQSCQHCHMPAVSDVAGCGKYASEGLLHATGGRRHDLGGGNRFMIEVLRSLYGNRGTGEVDDSFYDIAGESIDRTMAAAATLEVEPPEAVDLGIGVETFTVTVTNESGHKLPTGYSEGRVMWIEVTARYEGTLVYSSGRWLDGEGPEEDPQVRRYEAVAVNFEDQRPFHLLRSNTWVVDNRIPPKGLAKSLETDPVGDRYTADGDGIWPHWDVASYTFPPAEVVDVTPEENDALELRVRLLYLVNTPEYLEFLVGFNGTNSAGAIAFDAFAALGGVQPSVLAEQVFEIPLSGLREPADETTGGSTTSGQTSGGASTGATSTGPASTGAPTTGASGGSTGAATSAGADDSGGSEGCGCRSADGEEESGLALGFTFAFGLGLVARRRRRRRRRWV